MLLLSSLIISAFRLFLIRVPFFNGDEGVSAAIGMSILDGGVIYRDSVDHRGPVSSFFYAWIFRFFGLHMTAIHAVLLVIVLCVLLHIYFLGVRLWDKKAAGWAALFFALSVSLSRSSDVLAFHTEWCAVFFTTLAMVLIFYGVDRQKRAGLFLAGLCSALAFYSKQVALADLGAVFLASYLFRPREQDWRVWLRGAIDIGSSFIAANLLFFLYFWSQGAWQDFWFYFYEYNAKYYAPAVSWIEKLRLFFAAPFEKDGFFYGISAVPALLFMAYFFKKEEKPEVRRWIGIWGFLSYLAASSTGRAYGHYYLMVLPALCLAAGRFAAEGRAIKMLAIPAAAGLLFLTATTPWVSRAFAQFESYKKNGFLSPELQSVSQFIKENSAPQDTLFVWGWNAEIYPLSGRFPASRYLYCNFLTGLIAWVNTHPSIDTSGTIVPGAWENFSKEMEIKKPLYVVDASRIRRFEKYPVEKFPVLQKMIAEKYFLEKDFYNKAGDLSYRLYRRLP